MRKQFFITFAAILILAACNDPVFYNISQEEKILDPKIEGSPTNFVIFKGYMYVASGDKIYRYGPDENGKGKWDDAYDSKPGGSIYSLAVTNTRFYALCQESSGTSILKYYDDNAETWIKIEFPDDRDYNSISSIYSAGNQLFIGASKYTNTYTGIPCYILSLNGSDFLELAYTGYRLLNGAAYRDGTYFLSTKDWETESGGAIYITKAPSIEGTAELIILSNNVPFMGIINIGSRIVAIDRSGTLYDLPSSDANGPVPSINTSSAFSNRLATGALAVWEENKNDYSAEKLLLAGRQDSVKNSTSSGYRYGYLEVQIDGNGVLTGDFNEPGKKTPTSVGGSNENGRFQSTIGTIAVNYLFQAPYYIDNEKTLFASTQKDGVWSFRVRNDIPQWNAETENY